VAPGPGRVPCPWTSRSASTSSSAGISFDSVEVCLPRIFQERCSGVPRCVGERQPDHDL